ncbi:MAG: hypothetical protein ACJ8GJ_15055 [Vitreoscilla sp.]
MTSAAMERRITCVVDKYRPAIAALIEQAIAPHRAALAAAPPLATVVKMEVEKHRPRRPAVEAKKAKA